MSISEIETAIIELPANEVKALLSWLTEYNSKLWDAQIEEDLDSGRFDSILAEVDKEYDSGLARPL